jgi:hypothetical protein
MLDLHPAALIFRPFWSSPSRSRFRIPRGDIISAAFGRPDRTTAFYSPGSRLFDYAAFDVIACQIADGKLDLAVPRPDVRLVLHYLTPPCGVIRWKQLNPSVQATELDRVTLG